MTKTPQQIEISKEAEQMLEEIRNRKPGFDLSAAIEAMVRNIYAESSNTKPAKDHTPQTSTNNGKGSNSGNFNDCHSVTQNVIQLHGVTDAQFSALVTRLFPLNS